MDIEQIMAPVDAFLEASLLPPDPVLEAVARASEAAGLVPHAVTPLQAAFLAMMVRMSGARRVLELGCLGGYSAVAMARALPDGGSLLTTEIDTRTAQVAAANIAASGFGDRIDLRLGPALAVLEQQIAENAQFDLIFIDADKVNHKTYLECALALSHSGTVIIADNIVRGGGVLEADSQENSIRGVREMLAFAGSLENVEMTALQTVGAKGHDGMALFRVLSASR